MSGCESTRLQLGGLVLDGLDQAEERDVREHLDRCPACRSEHAQLAVLPSILAQVGDAPPAPPAWLRARVIAAGQRRRWTVRRLAPVAAGLILLAGAGGLVALLEARHPAPVAVPLEARGEFSAMGTAVLTPSSNGVVIDLNLRELDGLPPGAVYEGWLTGADGEPVSAGDFVPDERGASDDRLWVEGSLDDYRAIWVTVEPDAVHPSHDGPTVAAGELP